MCAAQKSRVRETVELMVYCWDFGALFELVRLSSHAAALITDFACSLQLRRAQLIATTVAQARQSQEQQQLQQMFGRYLNALPTYYLDSLQAALTALIESAAGSSFASALTLVRALQKQLSDQGQARQVQLQSQRKSSSTGQTKLQQLQAMAQQTQPQLTQSFRRRQQLLAQR